MYFGRRSNSKVRDYKKDISHLQSLSALTLSDLKKVRQYISEYPKRIKQVTEENIQIEEKNKEIDRENESAKKEAEADDLRKEKNKEMIREPIRKRQSELYDYLMTSKTWFGGFEAKIGYSVYRLSHTAKPAYEEYLALQKKWSDLKLYHESGPLPARIPHIAKKKPPSEYTVLRISGASVRVLYKKFSIEQVDEEIKKREAELLKQKEKFQEIRARAAANESETRAQAKKFRSDFESQMRLVNGCPYCKASLNISDAHLDHIYPVAKGGLSTKKNLVFVCSSCNLKKKKHTLRVFVRESVYDFEEIALRLEMLAKDF